MSSLSIDEPKVDWKKILKFYIVHVGEEEGTDFIDGYIYGLTRKENDALKELSKSLNEEEKIYKDCILKDD